MSMYEDFTNKIRKDLKKELGVENDLAVPTIQKISINVGVGKNRDNKNYIEEVLQEITAIGGQKPSQRAAKLSISNFKLRKGQLVGISVTLRGQRMWDFYEKLVHIVLPRVKDFRGVNEKAFDQSGNYNLGFRESIVFPEVDANKLVYNKSLQVTITTTAKTAEEGYALLKALDMPFRKKEGKGA